MHPTRRWWTVTWLGLLLAGWAVLVAQPVVLVGAAGVGGLLLAAQIHFVTAISRATVTVEQTPARSRVTAGETVPLTITVGASDAAFSLSVTPSFPASVDADVEPFDLDGTAHREAATVDLTFPIAGTVELGPPTVIASDPLGLFEQRLHVADDTEIAVDPRQLEDIHVGTGGEPITVAFGEHESGRLGTGLEPAEVRRYVPGEAVRQMDWKATARRGEPHVREFEAETDRVTTLVLDVRDRTSAGPAGETKLDHLREVALAFADRARTRSDPLGCYTVGDEGLTGAFEASSNAGQQLVVRRHLAAVEHTPGPDHRNGNGPGDRTAFDPAAARRRLTDLDDDAFGRSLRPFLESAGAYVERVEDRPLFSAVRMVTTSQRGAHWTVILTDDGDRTELREAVRLARAGGGNVIVFLTPTVLFEPGGLADLDAAYERYADFESFRRSLAGIERVQAFEVGPGDRLAQVLGAGAAGRQARGRS